MEPLTLGGLSAAALTEGIDVVAGTVGGVIAETIEGATVERNATVRKVEEGGNAAGLRAKRIGP